MGILDGKVSLITDAGSGIGRGLALRFAYEGSVVGILDIKADDYEDVAEEIDGQGGKVTLTIGDVALENTVGGSFALL